MSWKAREICDTEYEGPVSLSLSLSDEIIFYEAGEPVLDENADRVMLALHALSLIETSTILYPAPKCRLIKV